MNHALPNLLASVWPYRLVRWLLAVVFLYAGVLKLADPKSFAGTISDFGLVPEDILFATALVMIGLELLAGSGLLVDLRGALGLTVLLLLVFTGVLAYGMWLGLDIDCGCFGPGDGDTPLHEAFYRDLVLLAACGYLYWSRSVRAAGPLHLHDLWNRIVNAKGASEECAP